MSEDNDKKQEGDFFNKNSTYPDAVSIFTFHLRTLEEVKNDCYIVLDTNALIVPYTISNESLVQIRKTYETIVREKRLVVPGQVCREFANIRPNKIGELYQKIAQKKDNIQSVTKEQYPLLESIKEYKDLLEVIEKVRGIMREYKDSIDALLSHIQEWVWNDPVSLMYKDLFSGEIIFDLPINEKEIISESRRRKKDNIPPGYKDDNPGDLIIWLTILELGRKYKKSVIFVSGDEKADWFHRSYKKPLYPRYELVDEFRRVSDGQSFHCITFSKFLSLYGASNETIEEVLREETIALEERAEVNLVGTPAVAQDAKLLSDVGVEFEVLYNIRPGIARLRIRGQTLPATQYGVKYQLGREQADGVLTLSKPLDFIDVRATEVEGNLLNGEKVIVRMVDEHNNHLAGGGIDQNHWPPNARGDTIIKTQYWLYVPRERLRPPPPTMG